MELKRSDLRDSGQTLHSVNFEIGLAVAEDRDELEEVRRAWHGMALKELFARSRPAP